MSRKSFETPESKKRHERAINSHRLAVGAGNSEFAPSGVLNTSSDAIVVTTSFSNAFVGNINGSATASISSTGGDAFSQHADPRGVPNDFTALTVPTGGVEVISGLIDRSTTMVATSSNTTVDFNHPSAIGSTFSHGCSRHQRIADVHRCE